jgi:hypothetical protein
MSVFIVRTTTTRSRTVRQLPTDVEQVAKAFRRTEHLGKQSARGLRGLRRESGAQCKRRQHGRSVVRYEQDSALCQCRSLLLFVQGRLSNQSGHRSKCDRRVTSWFTQDSSRCVTDFRSQVTRYYKWPLEKLFRDLRQQVMPKLANDNYGGLVCDSITRVIRPGWARNTANRWYFFCYFSFVILTATKHGLDINL